VSEDLFLPAAEVALRWAVRHDPELKCGAAAALAREIIEFARSVTSYEREQCRALRDDLEWAVGAMPSARGQATTNDWALRLDRIRAALALPRYESTRPGAAERAT